MEEHCTGNSNGNGFPGRHANVLALRTLRPNYPAIRQRPAHRPVVVAGEHISNFESSEMSLATLIVLWIILSCAATPIIAALFLPGGRFRQDRSGRGIDEDEPDKRDASGDDPTL
jgi:hypothetical protein